MAQCDDFLSVIVESSFGEPSSSGAPAAERAAAAALEGDAPPGAAPGAAGCGSGAGMRALGSTLMKLPCASAVFPGTACTAATKASTDMGWTAACCCAL